MLFTQRPCACAFAEHRRDVPDQCAVISIIVNCPYFKERMPGTITWYLVRSYTTENRAYTDQF